MKSPMNPVPVEFEGVADLTIRDVFAAFAMMGDLANSFEGAWQAEPNSAQGLAIRAYSFADAMLLVREEGQK